MADVGVAVTGHNYFDKVDIEVGLSYKAVSR